MNWTMDAAGAVRGQGGGAAFFRHDGGGSAWNEMPVVVERAEASTGIGFHAQGASNAASIQFNGSTGRMGAYNPTGGEHVPFLASTADADENSNMLATTAWTKSRIAEAVFARGSSPTWKLVWSGASTDVLVGDVTGGAIPGIYLITSNTTYSGIQGTIQIGGDPSITARNTIETRRVFDTLSVWETEASSRFRLLNVLIPLGFGSQSITPATITAIYRLV